jgi:hypothetical protein
MRISPRIVIARLGTVALCGSAAHGGSCGAPAAGDCCVANGTPNCNVTACCEAVCEIDDFCCKVEWDTSCAASAGSLPECPCGAGMPVNDDCADAIEIFDGSTAYSTQGATTDGPPLPAECDKGFGLDFGADIWFTYMPSCDGTLTVSTCNQADYDSRLAAYDGGCAEQVLLACNDDGPGCAGFTSEMLVPVICGQPILLRVGGFDVAEGNGTLTLTCSGSFCSCPGEGDCCEAGGAPGCDDAECCDAVCNADAFCCTTEWDDGCASFAALVCTACGGPPAIEPLDLDWNWNGVVHGGEAGSPDAADGYRSIADRGLTSGTANALGGVSGEVDAFLSYSLVTEGGSLDTIFLGGPRPTGGGEFGFDAVVDGDNIGVAPNWDPTGGTGELASATSSISPVTITESFALGLLYDASVSGGTFDVTLGFDSGLELTVILSVPDWFADFNGTASPPSTGVAIQAVLAGPLSDGDGFESTEQTDLAVAGPPLNVLEAVITYGSLLDLGEPILGETLTSITFDDPVGAANDAMTVGIYAASVTSDSPTCDGDVDGSGSIDVDDLVAVILAWGPCGAPCPEDIDGNGAVDVDDLVTVILGWGPCP